MMINLDLRTTLLLAAITLLCACKDDDRAQKLELPKSIDCVAAFHSEDTSEAAWKCRDSLRDSIDLIFWRKEDSTRYSAFFNPDTSKRADFIIDYSYEEGVFSLIAWRSGLITVHDGRFPPKPKPIDLATIELASRISDSLKARGGKKTTPDAWKISRSADYRTFVNVGGEFHESRISECHPPFNEVCQPLTQLIMNMFLSERF